MDQSMKYVPPHMKQPHQNAFVVRRPPVAPLVPSGVYERSKLPKFVQENYRAAGVLPYVLRTANAPDGRQFRSLTFLLGKQDTKSQDRCWRQRWVEFGGKVEEADDTPETTALRELSEETNSSLGDVRLHNLCIWNAMCKFVLYFGEMVDGLPPTLKANEEISEFRFVERDVLMRSLRVGRMYDAEISYRTRSSLMSTKAWNLIRAL
jgi:8-oxo-dGTP pyrophosphatase MutT (NUDIX family)